MKKRRNCFLALSGILLIAFFPVQRVSATQAHAVACPSYVSWALAPLPDLHGTDISGCDLAGEGGGMLGTDFGGVTAIGTDFAGFNFSTHSELGGANLTSANLSGADLNQVGLAGADLKNADLIGADLSSANASGVDFTGANLSGATLVGANLTGAVLTNATLTNVDLDKANFTGATLSGVVSSGLTGTPQNLPSGWTIQSGALILSGKNPPSNVTITPWTSTTTPSAPCPAYSIVALAPFPPVHGTDISGCDLAGEGGGMLGTDFGGVTAIGTDFAGFNFSTHSELGGANLTSANLSGADLNQVGLAGADLKNADLIGADLSSANASGVDFTGANLSGATLVGANLTGAVLTNATLTNVDLDKANFSRTNLSGVVSSGLTGTPQNLPSGWVLHDGALVRGTMAPETFKVTFAGSSSSLSGAAKTYLSSLAARLTPHVSITIAGYARSNGALAKARAIAVSNYLSHKVPVHSILKTVTNTILNVVTITVPG